MTEVRACAELILTATIKFICICPYAAASWSGALRTDSLLTAAVFIWTGCFSGHRAARTVKHKIFTRRCDKLGDFHRMPLGVRVGRELTLHQHQCDLCVNWRLQCISQGKQQFFCWAITTADLKKKKGMHFLGGEKLQRWRKEDDCVMKNPVTDNLLHGTYLLRRPQ